jgi:hypothetical protein
MTAPTATRRRTPLASSCIRAPQVRAERRIVKLRVSKRLGPARIAFRLGLNPSTVALMASAGPKPLVPSWPSTKRTTTDDAPTTGASSARPGPTTPPPTSPGSGSSAGPFSAAS